MAAGINKDGNIIPIVFSMAVNQFESPIKSYQVFEGRDEQSMESLAGRLLKDCGLKLDYRQFKIHYSSYYSKVKVFQVVEPVKREDKAYWENQIEDLLESGRSLELQGLRDSMYTSLGTEDPVSLRIHDLFSRSFLQKKFPKQALEEVEKALTFSKTNISLLHRKGLILLELGRLDDCRHLLMKIEADHPNMVYNPEIAGLKGRLFKDLYKSLNDAQALQNAIDAYRTGFHNDRYSYYCGVNVVNLLIAQGNESEAKTIAHRVLEVCHELVEQYGQHSFWLDFTIGELELINGNDDWAVASYSNGKQRNPAPQRRQCESAEKSLDQLNDRITIKPEVYHAIKTILNS